MSDRPQRGRRPDDLEAAESLVVLSKNPRRFAPRSVESDDAGSSSVSADASRDGAHTASGETVKNETSSSSASGIPTWQGNARGAQSARSDTQQALPAAQDEPQPQATSANPRGDRPREPVSGEQALQAYLVRQQYIAGVPPEQMTHMRRRRNQGQQTNTPAIVQITNNGVSFPEIPPAQFNGVFHPLPVLPRGVPGDGAGGSPAEAFPTQSIPGPPLFPPRNVQGNSQYRISRPVVPPNTTQRLVRPEDILPRRPDPGLHRRSSAPCLHTANKPYIQVTARADAQASGKFDLLGELLKHPELFLEVIGYLGPSELVHVQSISKIFQTFVKGHYEDAIMSISAKSAPESALLYPGRCYPRLCIPIPKTGKIPHGRTTRFRMVAPKIPSIRWLHMINYREETTEIILCQLEKSGLDLPARCSLVIKKLWFLMDIHENTRRIWTVQNKNIWPDVDLFLALLFLIKVEMFLQNAGFAQKRNRVRRLLLGQKSMTLLREVVCYNALMTHNDLVRAYIRWQYMPFPHETGVDIFNVPAEQVGSLIFEGYEKQPRDGVMFQAPDEVLLRECVTRNLDLGAIHVDYFFYDDRIPIYIGKRPGEPMGEEMYTEATWMKDINTDGRGKNMNRFDVVVIE